MTTLAFVVPAYRRFELTRVCLRQLARTCDALAARGIDATTVVVADDENLQVAELLGFATVRRENSPLGRKFNDGIEYAASPRYLGCEYVVPIGSDNWIDPELVVAQMPPEGMIGAHRLCLMIHESGVRSCPLRIHYDGGDGIRTIPSSILEPLDYRPAEEDRNRAIDTSIWTRLGRANRRMPGLHYVDIHPAQVISFQSADEQLNHYWQLRSAFRAGDEREDHWDELARYYPAQAIAEVREIYARRHGPRVRPEIVVPL